MAKTIRNPRHALGLLAAALLAACSPSTEGTDEGPPPARRRSSSADGSGAFGRGSLPGVSVRRYSRESVEGGASDVDVTDWKASMGFPLWRGKGQALIANVKYGLHAADGDVVLPDTGRPLPETLEDVSLGLTYYRMIDPRRSFAAVLSVGSASDKPFEGPDETAVRFFTFYRKPARDKNSWLLVLIYLNNSALGSNLVFPGFAYNWRPSDEFRMTIGMPFVSALWTPGERWSIRLSANPSPGANAGVDYRATSRLRCYAQYGVGTTGYFLADRTAEDDRFFNYEQRVEVGCRIRLSGKVVLRLGVGYAYDRRYFEGESLWENHDRVDLGDATYAAARIGMARW
jgi:hypothetical protein